MSEPKPQSKKGIESRQAPRAPFTANIRFAIAPKMRQEINLMQHSNSGQAIDIGLLGLAFQCPVFLPKGTRIHGKIPVAPLGQGREKSEWGFAGTVKNCQMIPGKIGYRIGVSFDRIAKRNKELIDAFVKRHLNS